MAIRIGLQHPRLLLDRQFAVQREHVGTGVDEARRQRACGPCDLALSGQEHQHITGMPEQRVLDSAPGLLFEFLLATRREMRDGHRPAAPGAAQAWCVEEIGEAFAIERRRHQHDAQVRPQRGLHVQRQREAEVAGQMTFVELVEQQRANAIQRRIVLQHPRQDALRDDFDPGPRGHLVVETDAIADGLADAFTALPRHEPRSRTRGDATRFKHHDPAAIEPGFIEQRERHLRGLAGAGRRFEYQTRMPRK